MKKILRKYLVSGLSLLLVLSNFSFATQLMFCNMNDNAQACECSHDNGKPYDGVSITKVKAKCCTEETTELSNTNTLLTFKTELPQDINTFGSLIFNNSFELNLNNNPSVDLILDISHFPKLDIPILTSSLLI